MAKTLRHFLFAAALFSFAGAARAEPDAKTVRLWRAKCASCHGADGNGKTEQGEKMGVSDMTSAAWQKKTTDDAIKKAILDGKKAEGKTEGMDPYKDSLSAEQIDALAAHVRTLAK